MGAVEEARKLLKEGRNENEVAFNMQQKGVSQADIKNTMNQAKIKEAVTGQMSINPSFQRDFSQSDMQSSAYTPSYNPNEQDAPPAYESQESYAPDQGYAPQGQMDAPPAYESQESYAPDQSYSAQEQQYPIDQTTPDQYRGESASNSQLSPEIMNEIADQVITERISTIKAKVDSFSEFKSITETKINYLDERLKRIEKTIDRLQLSVLQKVGDYVNSVQDIKKELQETQKSFKYLSDQSPNKSI